ncbi:MAG: hypothetical protein V4714_15415 [Bacteroidota bacterium]
MPTTRNKKEKRPTVPPKVCVPPFLPGIKLNIYNSEQINALGGIDLFSKAIGNDKPIAVPDFGFTSEEWEKMLKEGI